ncbi:MAG: DNA/RNA non-specific endonuclease [Pseudomonadota bacterium]
MSPQGLLLAGKSRFEIYLRTGVVLTSSGASLALKYNPWHDIEDGRFTRAGMGRKVPPRFGGFEGGGGGFGGAGASGSWQEPKRPAEKPPKKPTSATAAGDNKTPGDTKNPVVETFTRNGYAFGVDAQFRTRRVTGTLTPGPHSSRSRSMQSGAGRPDRRQSDDGGHYIAVRFNGPREKFNHFAQDANFNRGQYRALEDQWAKAIARGEKVLVDLKPAYRGSSQRPSSILIVWTTGTSRKRMRLKNERGG